jgi:hypothetical protein
VGDEFQREYLGDDALHEERVVSRGFFVGFVALAAAMGLFGVAGLVMGALGDWQGFAAGAFMLAMAALLGFSGVTASVIRTLVRPKELVSHTGWRREIRIPLAAIRATGLESWSPEIRSRAAGQKGESILGMLPGKALVRVDWTDEHGAERASWLVSEAPAELARAIDAARAGRVRVAGSGDDVSAEDGAEGGAGDETSRASSPPLGR